MLALSCTHYKYQFLDKGFIYQWQKYLPSVPFEIFYTDIDNWSGSIQRRLKEINDDQILFVLTDYWLNAFPDLERIKLALNYVKDGICQKFDLTDQVAYWGGIRIDDDIIEAHQYATYRQSSQAAIWDRKMLIEYMGHNHKQSPWAWETGSWSKDDNKIIYGMSSKILQYSNTMYKGKPDEYQISKILSNDKRGLIMIGSLTEDGKTLIME